MNLIIINLIKIMNNNVTFVLSLIFSKNPLNIDYDNKD